MSSRHRSREVALQALYALDVARLRRASKLAPTDVTERTDVTDPTPAASAAALEDSAGSCTSAQEAYERVAEHFEIPEGSRAFAKELVISVTQHQSELDERISQHARNWRVSRMAAVDRNVLRLATFELIHTETPIGVILDEAVELARRFGSDASPAFVNGILDALAHDVRKAAP